MRIKLSEIIIKFRLVFSQTIFALIVGALFNSQGVNAQGPVKVDSNIPNYTKVSGVSGNINSIGSDTMNNLMTLWCEGFNNFYP